MSQHSSNNYKQVIKQYQKQLATIQVQIQVLIAREAGREAEAAIPRPNTGSNVEMTELQMFNRKVGQVSEFLTVCKGDQLIFESKTFWKTWRQKHYNM